MSKLVLNRLDIISMIDLKCVNWVNKSTTNCYAFALGLDVPEKKICEAAYVPGVMSDNPINIASKYSFTIEELIECLESDFKFLDITFRENVSKEELEEGEWLIALYVSYLYSNRKDRLDDYHFLRLGKDDIWYHKNGFRGKVLNIDNNRQIITDPLTCELTRREYVKTYALKLK